MNSGIKSTNFDGNASTSPVSSLVYSVLYRSSATTSSAEAYARGVARVSSYGLALVHSTLAVIIFRKCFGGVKRLDIDKYE